jgi:prepilin-type N-terminal cleavage/methylation domain-containing protein
VISRSCEAVRRRSARHRDDGFSLIEVMVAMVVLALFATAVVAVLATSFGTTRTNKLRDQASGLATRQIEIVQNTGVLDVPDGQVYGTASGSFSSTPAAIPINGTNFTVSQDAEYVPANSAKSTCESPSGTRLAYKRVTVTVSWPDMGASVPPRLDTLLQLPVTGLDNTKGVLAVPVKDASGQPVESTTVTVSEGGAQIASEVTGTDGCAVITDLPPASDYTVSAGRSGYVDTTGTITPSHSAPTISAATLSTDTGFVMDEGGAVQLALVPPGGSFGLPVTPFNVALTNTTASPQYSQTFPDCSTGPSGFCSTGAGFSRTVGSPDSSSATQNGLFPFSTQDSVYVNDYPDTNAPGVSVAVVGGTTATTTTPAGGVPLGGVTVTNNTPADTMLYAYEPSMSSNNLLQLDATAVAKDASAGFALPYGTWCIGTQPSAAQACAGPQVVMLNAASRTAAVSVNP